MPQFRRVLHPTDFSPASEPAFERAVALARQNRAPLALVHVLEPPPVVLEDSFLSARAFQRMGADARQRARARLRALAARARQGGVRATSAVLDGIPFEEIVRAARRIRADVIVIGTHGRTGLARLFLGSVAERVVGTAACPVLTVAGRKPR